MRFLWGGLLSLLSSEPCLPGFWQTFVGLVLAHPATGAGTCSCAAPCTRAASGFSVCPTACCFSSCHNSTGRQGGLSVSLEPQGAAGLWACTCGCESPAEVTEIGPAAVSGRIWLVGLWGQMAFGPNASCGREGCQPSLGAGCVLGRPGSFLLQPSSLQHTKTRGLQHLNHGRHYNLHPLFLWTRLQGLSCNRLYLLPQQNIKPAGVTRVGSPLLAVDWVTDLSARCLHHIAMMQIPNTRIKAPSSFSHPSCATFHL